MTVISTRYFISNEFAAGEFATTLRGVIVRFVDNPDAVHFALIRELTSDWHESKDPASWSDVNGIGDLGAEGFLLRAWFQDQGNASMHFAFGGEIGTTRLTIASPNTESAEELFVALADALDLQETEPPLERIRAALEEAQFPPRDFKSVVSDLELAHILSIRWDESYLAYYAGAYLSTIIMLGSVLEGVLLDRIEQNPKQANQAKSAPSRQGKVLGFHDWTLANLIEVAHECGWLDRDVREFSAALRDYRNLVHPSEQRKRGFAPDSGTCNVARAVIVAAIEDLARGAQA